MRDNGKVVGASSVFHARFELVAGRHFLAFRSLLDEGRDDRLADLVRATFDAFDAERRESRADAEGLAVLLDSNQRRRHPEAEWSDPRLIYAGYLQDGRQLRIAYFSDEVSSMSVAEPEGGWLAGTGYQIARFDQQETVSADDVIGAWTSEGGLDRAEAERRLSEVLLVATDARGALAGITTAYLARNEQLQADMWYVRAFVLEAHRGSNVAVAFAQASRDRLVERFVDGEDRRGLGIIFEVENEDLKRRWPKGLWFESDFLLIGHSTRGAHVRVHYFPGVLAPEPSHGGT